MTFEQSIEAADQAVLDCVVVTTYSTVTPELAKEWLSKNLRNRKIRRPRVERYKGVMDNRDWVDNGDSCLCFDDKGNLLNGQHRLTALIELNRAMAMRISYNVDPKTFTTFDVGLNRSRGTSVSLAFPGWAPTKATSVSACLVKENNLRFGAVTLGSNKTSDLFSTTKGAVGLLQIDPTFEEVYDDLRRNFTNAEVSLFFGWGLLTFIARRIYGIHPKASRTWLHGLITGQGLLQRDSRITLRTWFNAMRVKKTLLPPNERIFVIIKAWDAAVNKDNYTMGKSALAKRGKDPLAPIRRPDDLVPSREQMIKQWEADQKKSNLARNT